MGMMIHRAVKRIRERESAAASNKVVNTSVEQNPTERSSAKRGRKGKR